MRHVKCNLCNTEDSSTVTSYNSYTVVRCIDCGLVYVNPQPEPADLLCLYEGYHSRKEKDEASWEMLMRANFMDICDKLSLMFPDKGVLLDIGCGYGHFLQMMQRNGWKVKGIEPAAQTFLASQGKGLDVQRTAIEESTFPVDSFDVITAFYVLEHLTDPISVLRQIYSLLKPGGIVVIRVPHTAPIVSLLGFMGIRNNLFDLPFHLYDFSPHTIRQFMLKTGFIDVSVMPGIPTRPRAIAERLVSLATGTIANVIYSVSMKRLLIPGVSKTVVARKPNVAGLADA